MEQNSKDHALARSKDDWIEFGELRFSARSRKTWQMVAVVAIFGFLAVVTTYTWLYKDMQLQTERLSLQLNKAIEEKQHLLIRLASVNDAIKDYTQLINLTKNEKDQLTIEKGILEAQVRLLEAINEAQETVEIKEATDPSPKSTEHNSPILIKGAGKLKADAR
jgi:hypothetical protein